MQFGSKIKAGAQALRPGRRKREEEREINSEVRQVTKNQAQIFPYLTLYASPHQNQSLKIKNKNLTLNAL